MSLQAAAAGAGLIEATPELRAEFDRFNPLSAEERNRKRVAELTAVNPYGDASKGVGLNLTAALELEGLDAKTAQRLKAEAAAPAADPTAADRAANQQAAAEARAASLNAARRFLG